MVTLPRPRKRRRHAAPILLLLSCGGIIAAGLASVFIYWQPLVRDMDDGNAPPLAVQKTAVEKIYRGSILIPERGVRCTEMGFDNRTGFTWHKGIVDCDEAALPPTPLDTTTGSRADRIQAIRKALQGSRE